MECGREGRREGDIHFLPANALCICVLDCINYHRKRGGRGGGGKGGRGGKAERSVNFNHNLLKRYSCIQEQESIWFGYFLN